MTAALDQARITTRELVAAIDPLDPIEAGHQAEVLDWIDGGAPLWRTAKPATPPMHLVSYAVVVDGNPPGSDAHHVLLVDHRLAGLWLPTGGHIEPGEHPATTARRELAEELGISPDAHPTFGHHPVLVTITETVGDAAPTTMSPSGMPSSPRPTPRSNPIPPSSPTPAGGPSARSTTAPAPDSIRTSPAS